MEESFEQVAGSVCLEVYREALKGVVTASRRYKDELLEACLELLLSAPATVMTIHVSHADIWSVTSPQHCTYLYWHKLSTLLMLFDRCIPC